MHDAVEPQTHLISLTMQAVRSLQTINITRSHMKTSISISISQQPEVVIQKINRRKVIVYVRTCKKIYYNILCAYCSKNFNETEINMNENLSTK